MTDMRRCIGSGRFGIEAHDAPVEDFPVQPIQRDGLGRMCKPHWNQYTAGLARDAKIRKAADAENADRAAGVDGEPGKATSAPRRRAAGKPEPIRTRAKRAAKVAVPAAGSQGDAG